MNDSGSYPIPGRIHRVEDVIQRSRFITTVAHAPDPDAAHAFLASIRDEFSDATHNCWAFLAGPPGSTSRIGMSDDGEPHGTAGRPMLTALLHSGVGEVVAVSTRYYGGTKLGTGGLSRAYSGGVVTALKQMPREEKVDRRSVSLTLSYSNVDSVQRLIAQREWVLTDEVFGSDIRLEILVPVSEIEQVHSLIADQTHGSGIVEVRTEA